MDSKPTVALHTLGCKLNHAETAMIGKQFLDRGFRVVEFGRPADVTVINTCSVTQRADRECRQLIRRARRISGNSCVVVTGCYAQLEPEQVASIDGVSAVLGTREKFRLFDHLEPLAPSTGPNIFVTDISEETSFGPAFPTTTADRTRAFLKIQDGCDYNCSFCTIPLARGKSRSQPVEDCLEQASMLLSEGFREIVLTGVNVGDYGQGSGDFLLLLRRLSGLRGLERLRISSIEPNLLTDEILDFVASTDVMCNHFHIPLQSGHDDILRAMRRRYTTGQYEALIRRITERIPGCGIGVDVIVGFPGETDRHFEATCRFIEALPVSYLHVFTYSERPGTPAAAFGAPVRPSVRFARNRSLRMLGERKKRSFYRKTIGQTVPVLMEDQVEDDLRTGLTGEYIRVGIPAVHCAGNTIVPVTITGLKGEICVGHPEGGATGENQSH